MMSNEEARSSSNGVLADRVVLVTGGSSGIGRAIALAAAGAGADVALTYRQNESGARTVANQIEQRGRRAAIFHYDATVPASIERLGSEAQGVFGQVDVWVNNAGADILTGPNASLSDVEKLDLLLSVDLRGTILASWQAASLLQASGGVIINMSWDHVLTGMPGANPGMFAAVKGGVLSFSKALARSVAPRVRVNVIAPGWIETTFAEGLDKERRQRVADETPLGRWGLPDDVAAAAVFLASPSASFITGQTILVGGGVVMG